MVHDCSEHFYDAYQQASPSHVPWGYCNDTRQRWRHVGPEGPIPNALYASRQGLI